MHPRYKTALNAALFAIVYGFSFGVGLGVCIVLGRLVF